MFKVPGYTLTATNEARLKSDTHGTGDTSFRDQPMYGVSNKHQGQVHGVIKHSSTRPKWPSNTSALPHTRFRFPCSFTHTFVRSLSNSQFNSACRERWSHGDKKANRHPLISYRLFGTAGSLLLNSSGTLLTSTVPEAVSQAGSPGVRHTHPAPRRSVKSFSLWHIVIYYYLSLLPLYVMQTGESGLLPLLRLIKQIALIISPLAARWLPVAMHAGSLSRTS
ncbi:hypothetical protein RRG08_037597 [Elysia crispata]|uniref:Uncharacterized protein n=1 Tax=Elysia crispata TaxID=231223 RepID=A0AAE0YH28_9GAST|nr:hypothetical protein RRG08_037597 [Elysia crispata]